jgi:hypothetical protein
MLSGLVAPSQACRPSSASSAARSRWLGITRATKRSNSRPCLGWTKCATSCTTTKSMRCGGSWNSAQWRPIPGCCPSVHIPHRSPRSRTSAEEGRAPMRRDHCGTRSASHSRPSAAYQRAIFRPVAAGGPKGAASRSPSSRTGSPALPIMSRRLRPRKEKFSPSTISLTGWSAATATWCAVVRRIHGIRLRITWLTAEGWASTGSSIVRDPPGSALSPTVRRRALTATRQHRSSGSPASARILATHASSTQSVVALIAATCHWARCDQAPGSWSRKDPRLKRANSRSSSASGPAMFSWRSQSSR